MDPDEKQFQYNLEEYRALRAEIERTAQQINDMEIKLILGAAAVYAWLATLDPKFQISWMAWLIPIPLPLFGLFKWFTREWAIKTIADYTRLLENQCLAGAAAGSPRGWENFLAEKDRVTKASLHRSSRFYAYIHWVVFLVSTIIVPILALKKPAAAQNAATLPAQKQKADVYVVPLPMK